MEFRPLASLTTFPAVPRAHSDRSGRSNSAIAKIRSRQVSSRREVKAGMVAPNDLNQLNVPIVRKVGLLGDAADPRLAGAGDNSIRKTGHAKRLVFTQAAKIREVASDRPFGT